MMHPDSVSLPVDLCEIYHSLAFRHLMTTRVRTLVYYIKDSKRCRSSLLRCRNQTSVGRVAFVLFCFHGPSLPLSMLPLSLSTWFLYPVQLGQYQKSLPSEVLIPENPSEPPRFPNEMNLPGLIALRFYGWLAFFGLMLDKRRGKRYPNTGYRSLCPSI